MSRLSTFVLGMVVGAGLLHGVTTYHIVRAPDGFHLIAKQPPRLSQTYVDIRGFTMTDWASHPQLATALVQADKQQLLGDAAAGALQEQARQLLPDWPKSKSARGQHPWLCDIAVTVVKLPAVGLVTPQGLAAHVTSRPKPPSLAPPATAD